MLQFFAAAFAIAGVCAVLGPILIHLLNRQRYRVVRWAAMDFLLQARARSRRLLRFRDVLLLLLRALALILFGLALARPYFSRADGSLHRNEPFHAVLLIDNSLSMSYELLQGTALDEAKAKARDFVRRLPAGSWITVLPLCGPTSSFSRDAHRTKEEAIEAIAAIRCVDRRVNVAAGLELAVEAGGRVQELPAKRLVLIGDQQEINWPPAFEGLPDISIVQVGTPAPENAWVAELHVADGVADAETPTTLTAVLRYQGAVPRAAVPVTLRVQGVTVATQAVDLEPGSRCEVQFLHQFSLPAELPMAFVPLEVSMLPDCLPADDRRTLSVPVVANLPVVFVDAHGADEDPARGRFGETYRLRRLLAPFALQPNKTTPATSSTFLRHHTAAVLEASALLSARLVVVAGLERPGAVVGLLREHVERGGSLLIAAGGDFDPALWSNDAWLDGKGILPSPLKPRPLGQLPAEAQGAREAQAELKPMLLEPTSLTGEGLLAGGLSSQDLADLCGQALFFKVVEVDSGAVGLDPDPPRVLARFTNGVPFAVERKIGLGTVVFLASGLQPEWNTLMRSNAVILVDRLLRSLLGRTLPVRSFEPAEAIVLPLTPAERRIELELIRPDLRNEASAEPLAIEALSGDVYGVTVRDALSRGHYLIRARDQSGWQAPLAVNGSETESELAPLNETTFRERLGNSQCRWVSRAESIPLESAKSSGENLWRWLLAAVLVILLVELGLGSWLGWKRPS